MAQQFNKNTKHITTPVINPVARDRLYTVIERVMLPQTVEATLAGALQGDLRQQWLLFIAMIDTWPRLQKALAEVAKEVAKAPFEFLPFSPPGKDPIRRARERADLVKEQMLGMRPDPLRNERGLMGLTEYLAQGYFTGHSMVEILWQASGRPRAAQPRGAQYFGYPRSAEEEDRLMLNRSGHWNGRLEDFPPHRFLVGIRCGHQGHPSVAAPLRSLVGWWLAANFGLKWMMQFAQVYGVPLRWATYPAGDECSLMAVSNMLENIGSAGWGAFPSGTQLDIKEASRSAGDLPQKLLIDMADRQADIAILGQSLTTDVADSGSRALGDVHRGVRQDVIEAVAKWVADIYNHQFIPAIIAHNYQDEAELPHMAVEWPEKEDEQAKAERDKVLVVDMGMAVNREWLYERHGIPLPEDNALLFVPTAQAPRPESGDSPTSDVNAAHAHRDRRVLDRPVVKQLTDTVLQGLSGTAPEFLAGVRPFFADLVRKALSGDTTDDDFVRAMEQAVTQIPELFEHLTIDALERTLEQAIGTSMMAGVGERLVDFQK